MVNRKSPGIVSAAFGLMTTVACNSPAPVQTTDANPASRSDAAAAYQFKGGFPEAATIQKAYDDADLTRAIEAYKFFYPGVAFAAGVFALDTVNVRPNEGAGVMQGSPNQLMFTPNSDTPYAFVPLDLHIGPIVVELPPGPLLCVVNDLNQQYVMDLGLPGPDQGKGGKHLILPPGYTGQTPSGYFVGKATTYRVPLLVRAIPPGGDTKVGFDMMKTIKIHPLNPTPAWKGIQWIDIGNTKADLTPTSFERTIGFWELLHRIVDEEPPYEPYRMNYGQLATLGIEKGKPFAPDGRMKAILEKAAQVANDQMRVQSFADRRPDRVMWPDRKWEWASLRPENGTFDTPSYRDLDARTKWFYQAMVESPAMFRRDPQAGSLYWLGLRDSSGAYLDGSKTYKLTVPLPVPGKLFWSVTVYDPDTRSEIQTAQNKAALRSLFELKDATGSSIDLFFGPTAPSAQESHWIQTLPNKGWFTYFRIYGPETPAFDKSWKPGDFEVVK
jgi:hypothetical protein